MSNILLLILGIGMGAVAIWLGISYINEVIKQKNTFKK